MKSEIVIRNKAHNIICKIAYTEQGVPVVSIKGKGCETDIVILPNQTVKVIDR